MMEATRNEANTDVINTEELEEMIGHVKKAIHQVKQKMKQENHIGVGAQLDQTMLQMIIAGMDVAEVYSPPRVTTMAREMGLKAGWSLDLTTNDTDGRAWDFNDPEMRNRAARKLEQLEGVLVLRMKIKCLDVV